MIDLVLSPHFLLSEFMRSDTASKFGIDNVPNLEHVANMQQLCIQVLEPLRCAFDVPIVIGSGFRSVELNRRVGGSVTSQHMQGMAADIRCQSVELGNAFFDWIRCHCEFDQLIRERAYKASKTFWIHVSYRADGMNRKQVINDLIKNK